MINAIKVEDGIIVDMAVFSDIGSIFSGWDAAPEDVAIGWKSDDKGGFFNPNPFVVEVVDV